MPRPCSVRSSAFAASDTTLPVRSNSTWSGVMAVGKILQNRSLHLRKKEGQRHQQSFALDCPEHELHELLERPNVGSAKFVNRARARGAVNGIGDSPRNVSDERRLKACQPATDQRQRRRKARKGSKAIEEIVLRPEQN